MTGGRSRAVALCAWAAHAVVLAQSPTPLPDFTAPPGSDQVVTSPVYTAPLPAGSETVARDAVELYRRTCLASVGDATALVDQALAAGLAPYAGGPEGDAQMASLLGNAPGQVYAEPGVAALMLAIGEDGRCTVWADRTDGPQLKAAFVAAMDGLRERGATVRAARDRTLQRGGGWRQQLGYDIQDARRSFSADAVTLLTPRPGMQALRAAPLARRAAAEAAPLPAVR